MKRQIASEVVFSQRRADGYFSIGEIARRLGLSTSMVRSWEALGLTRPARSQRKYRLYSHDDLRVLSRATYLRRVQGLNVPAILNQLRQEGLLVDGTSHLAENQKRPAIGPQLRLLRLEQGKSISSVAAAVGVSYGFLNNLERSRTSASEAMLRKLDQYYHFDLSALSETVDETRPLVRPRDRMSIESGPGVRLELLAAGKIAMQPRLFRIAPGAGNPTFCSHDGEEFLFLLRGRLVLELDREEFELRRGDAFYFNSNKAHRWSNPGRTETLVLWIVTPPS